MVVPGSVFCLNYEMIVSNTTKALVKYLNQNYAPDNLKIESKFELYEMGKNVASGVTIEDSKK